MRVTVELKFRESNLTRTGSAEKQRQQVWQTECIIIWIWEKKQMGLLQNTQNAKYTVAPGWVHTLSSWFICPDQEEKNDTLLNISSGLVPVHIDILQMNPRRVNMKSYRLIGNSSFCTVVVVYSANRPQVLHG